MLFWMFLIVAILCAIIWTHDYNCSLLGSISCIGLLISSAFVLVLGLMFLLAVDEEGCMSEEMQKYESLMYRYEHETDLVKRAETITEITEWNEDLKWNRKHQNNFWIGFVVPDIYDDLEYIELKEE